MVAVAGSDYRRDGSSTALMNRGRNRLWEVAVLLKCSCSYLMAEQPNEDSRWQHRRCRKSGQGTIVTLRNAIARSQAWLTSPEVPEAEVQSRAQV